ncbi:hypothetical protein [Lacipirellula sp.]|uniref:hypothetical protein n=1 Tax=Lacipirellula sp. TaxID=2691419 RepID=UPI003D139CDA
MVEQIAHSLSQRNVPKRNGKAGEGFIVSGLGKEALANARDVFAGKRKPLRDVRQGDPCSLVIFAYASGRSLRVDKVSASGDEVIVDYHLNAHEVMSSSAHFALVPLGELTPGKLKVTMKRGEDMGPKDIVARLASVPVERLVNASFSVEVSKAAK